MTIAPMTVVTTPGGTSTPACAPSTARSRMSEASTMSTPTSPDRGSMVRFLCRAGMDLGSSRTITGAHSPTKPIGPAMVTAAADSSTASRVSQSRSRRTFTPSTVAVSSPSPRMSSRGPASIAAASAARITGPSWVTAFRSLCTSEPLPQANSPTVSCWKRIMTRFVSEESASEVAEPARISRVVPLRPPADSASTRAAAASPPNRASPPDTGTGSTSPNAAAAATARYAPALTASVSGEAIALRAIVCSSEPATPSASPTQTPASSRGSREASSTRAASSLPPNGSASRSSAPTEEVPCVTCTAATSTVAARVRRTTPAAPIRRSGVSGGAAGVRTSVLKPRTPSPARRRTAGRTGARRRSRCRQAA